MMNNIKKLLFCISIVIIITFSAITINAEETSVVESNGTVFEYATYTVDGTTMAAITGYKSGNSDFVIPEKIGDYVVGKIAEKAFNDNNVVTSVVIPSSITVIESLAFRNCDMLTSVNISNSVVSVGDCAFENCDQLTNIVIGNSVNYWGSWCFANNPKLVNITFNEGLVNIGKRYLSSSTDDYASYIDKLYYYYSNEQLKSSYVDYYNAPYLSYPSLYGSPFANCTSLTTVTIPDSVTTIWQGAFAGCTSLTEITLGADAMTIGNYAFYNCSLLEKATLPEYVDTIGKGAFDNSALNTIYGESGTYAEKYATEKGLTFVDISNTEKYDVKYLENDGSEIHSLSVVPESNITVYTPFKPDYTFKGWAKEVNGEVIYAPGVQIKVDESMTLYAVWEKQIVSVASVSIDRTSATLKIGDTLTLTATVSPSNATNKSVIWASTDEDVATVVNGVVTAKNAGTATITVKTTDGNKTASCVVMVKDKEVIPTDLIFSLGEGKVGAGKTVNITLNIKNNPGIAGMGFDIGYNSDVMTLVAYESNSAWYPTSNFEKDPSNNPVSFFWSKTSDYRADSTLLTLTFKIKENVPVGEYPITLKASEKIVNQNLEELSYNVASGKITVVDYIAGDANGDALIDTKDAVLLAQYLAKWSVSVDMSSADCNADGFVDTKDAVLLAQYLAKWDVTLG